MYGTITAIKARDVDHRDAIQQSIETLVDQLSDASELVGIYLFATAADELALVTLYQDEAAAEALSARTRAHLGQLVGPHVAAPPQRLAGPAILARTR